MYLKSFVQRLWLGSRGAGSALPVLGSGADLHVARKELAP